MGRERRGEERERKGGEEGRHGKRGERWGEREGKEEQIGVGTVLYRIHYQQ